MTNKERLETAIAKQSSSLIILMGQRDSNTLEPNAIFNALDLTRGSAAALQSLQQSLSGVPEPVSGE